ncbi:hypothetical protein HALA3H3_1090003 [Halomonas sp. A3H3]|nr:hypothetical protein HALA3H3_1090003 [Halomonas sp. A3H3]
MFHISSKLRYLTAALPFRCLRNSTFLVMHGSLSVKLLAKVEKWINQPSMR